MQALCSKPGLREREQVRRSCNNFGSSLARRCLRAFGNSVIQLLLSLRKHYSIR